MPTTQRFSSFPAGQGLDCKEAANDKVADAAVAFFKRKLPNGMCTALIKMDKEACVLFAVLVVALTLVASAGRGTPDEGGS